MRLKLSVLILFMTLLLPLTAGDQEPVPQKEKTRYLNLDFENISLENNPLRWMINGRGYTIMADKEVVKSGTYSLRMESDKRPEKAFGLASSHFPVKSAHGKKIRYSGYIKTEDVKDGYAGLWCRIDGGDREMLGFDNMEARPVNDTTPWTLYTIEMDVPAEAVNIVFGCLLTGTGKAWFDGLHFTLDGKLYVQVPPSREVPASALAWIKKTAIPVKTADPIDDNSDLMPLKKIIGNRQIVALGEGTHGTSEFFKMKHRITKFLAEEMGFTVFAIEANMPEARAVNRYVLTGEGDPKKALAGMYFWTWNTREVLDMIEWMREFNASGKGHIEFYGFDMQFTEIALDNVTKFVEKADKNFLESLDGYYADVKAGREELKESRYQKRDKSPKWRESAQKVFEYLQANREKYIKTADPLEVDWIIQDALVIVQAAEVNLREKGMRSRDRSMADNLDWILKHKPKGTKIVTWAHNGHVSKSSKYYKSMGYYLDQRHGDDHIVLGFAFHQGYYTARGKNGINTYTTSKSQPGSVEWYFKSTGIPAFILDLSGAKTGVQEAQWLNNEMEFRVIGAVAMPYAFSATTVTEEFDVLIYFDKTTPTDCFRHVKYQEKKKEKNIEQKKE